MTTLDQSILRRIGELHGVATVVLFGSQAHGSTRADSDLDLAVLPSRSLDSESRRKLQTRLSADLADLSPSGRVDVILLDEAPELLRQRILEQGRVLVTPDPGAWKNLKLGTWREHADREHYRELLMAGQLARLKARRPSGRSPRALHTPGRTRRIPG